MIEHRVTGPFKGYYIAAYAGKMGELGLEYLGFYKIGRSASMTYWSVDGVVEAGCDSSLLRNAGDAMDAAEVLARGQIGGYGRLAPRLVLRAT